ncbi:hypothetical protein Aph02nite_80290 [Actinoplanes philippinensis]|nr:hypothetical protein Aph02nite_80290 [Actinoplanes philippinensis]
MGQDHQEQTRPRQAKPADTERADLAGKADRGGQAELHAGHRSNGESDTGTNGGSGWHGEGGHAWK